MAEVKCPGLPAFWVNGWLAAVGATVLVPGMRLRWAAAGTPEAVLSVDGGDPVASLVESWPSKEFLEDLPISENWNEVGCLKRKVDVRSFGQRAQAARRHPCSWALSSTMTDLAVDKNGEVVHAPFDAGGPGSIKWLHHRLIRVHQLVGPSLDRIRSSLDGHAERVSNSGLAFDQARLGSFADSTAQHLVDPVVETLAFFGLAILPVRGRGVDQRLGANRNLRVDAVQRGWRRPRGEGRPAFFWPAWIQKLDLEGIDALLDTWNPDDNATWSRVGVHAAWRSARYRSRGRETTQAIGSERL